MHFSAFFYDHYMVVKSGKTTHLYFLPLPYCKIANNLITYESLWVPIFRGVGSVRDMECDGFYNLTILDYLDQIQVEPLGHFGYGLTGHTQSSELFHRPQNISMSI